MIQSSELRIGNAVLINGKKIIMDMKMFHAVLMGFDGYVPEGIPITHEILEKYGFETDKLGCWSKIDLPHSPNELSINSSNGVGRGTVWLKNSLIGVNLPSMQYLHQVQNRYYELSYNELTYTP